MLTEKHCKKCGTTKPASEFYRSRKSKDGLQYMCKSCSLVSVKDYQAREGKSIINRSVKYGLAREEVRLFLEIPVCQACGTPFSDSYEMKFDHCHDGGHFRGVLCHPCNMACQGTSRDASWRLESCIRYLLRDMERCGE